VIFGALTKESLKGILDLDRRELIVLVPLVVLTILFGFYPAPLLDTSAAAVSALIDNLPHAMTAVVEAAPAAAAAH
jgi:NADH-quinone oxidoreductase subunit M